MLMRSVVEELEVSKVRDEVTLIFPRTEDGWSALTWLLARSPDKVGVSIEGNSNIRVHKQKEEITSNIPSICVVYNFDDKEVKIISAKFEMADVIINETVCGEKTTDELVE